MPQPNSDPARFVRSADLWQLAVAYHGAPAWASRRRVICSPGGLRRYLEHVIRSVPAYRKLSPSARLSKFPTVSRLEIQGHPSHFTAAGFRGWTIDRSTSGTTGRPLHVTFDLAAWYASTFGGYELVGHVLPELTTLASPGTVSVVMATSKKDRQPMRAVLPGLSYSAFNLVSVASGKLAATAARQTRKMRPLLLHGKPSALVDLMFADQAHGRGSWRPQGLLVSGENLYNDQRRELEDWYQCRVLNMYTSVEGGLIALECRYRRGMHILSDRCEVEVLTSRRRLQDLGDGELVVTNKVNWAMPFVRYRSGDTASVRNICCKCGFGGPTIVEMMGRQRKTFDLMTGTCQTARFDPIAARAREFAMTQVSKSAVRIDWRPRPNSKDSKFVKDLRALIEEHLGLVTYSICRRSRVNRPGGKAVRYL